MIKNKNEAYSMNDFVRKLKSKKGYARHFSQGNVLNQLDNFDKIEFYKLSNAYVIITDEKTIQEFREFYIRYYNNAKTKKLK